MIRLILFTLFLTTNSYAINCNIHKIYCAIKKLKPSIKHEVAKPLSDYLYIYSKKYNLDPMISVSIAMQESSFRNIVVTHRGVSIKDIDGPVQTIVTDIGIFQINAATAKHFKLHISSIKHDLEYAVAAHFKILSHKQKVCKAKFNLPDNEAWGCYHSYTKKQRLKYIRLVNRYLVKIR